MKIILLVSLVFILSVACLPLIDPQPEKIYSEGTPAHGKTTPPSNQSETEKSSFQDTTSSSSKPSTSFATLRVDEQSTWKMELPISDESNDDFNLEILKGDRSKYGRDFDIPIMMNEKVEHFIHYFQTRGRKTFSNWLARSEKYIPFMRNLLRENGLPEDLVYMALIESGFNPYAYSRRKASGPWQFIYLTGKKYGLKYNYWIDERRDPEKSTIAAAKYLKDLYDLFECWYLAAAGYNAGEGKIMNAIKRYRTEDFWELTKYRYLKKETKDYVPQMIAAALIAKEPEIYGFTDIEYQDPLEYEKVNVPEVTDLRLIAKACEISMEELKDLNPELLRWCTPPSYPDYEIKVPLGKKELFLKNFEVLQPVIKSQFKTHIVKKGETLSTIARFYQVDVGPIVEINHLKKSTRLSVGTHLLIPIPVASETPSIKVAKRTSHEINRHHQSDEIIYTIKKGDTLWSIANEMGVNIGALSRWNNHHPDKNLKPGDKLKIRIKDPSDSMNDHHRKKGEKEIVYIVKEGDTLWSIAKKYNLTISEIKTWNNLKKDSQIYPADRLKLRVGETKSSKLN